ncbi:hypothetical protein D9M73_161350 [compost metagenome]
MEGNRSCHRRTGAGQLQGAATAETEAEGRQLRGIQRGLAGLCLQCAQGALHAAAQQRAVVLHRHHRRTGLVGIGRAYRGAIDVGDQHHVVLPCHLPGNVDRALADAHPVRRHQQAGAWRGVRCVIDELAFESLAIHLVGDRLHGDLTHCGSSFFFFRGFE